MADDRELSACATTLLRIHGRDAGAHAGEARGHWTFTLIAERSAPLEAISVPESRH